MNKFILIFFVLLLTKLLNAQPLEQETLAKFTITDATTNGVDITPILLREEAYTVFYTRGDDGLVYMANVWSKSNSQSFGPMYSIENTEIHETYENYKADIFYFNWRYINNYNSKRGTAKVQVIKVYKPQGIAFILKVIPENLDLIIYKGYMNGTINFSNYE